MRLIELDTLLQRVTHGLICFLILAVPLFFIPYPFLLERGKFFIFFVGAVVCFLALLVRMIIQGRLLIPRARALGALGVYGALVLVATLFSPYVFGSLWGVNGTPIRSFFAVAACALFTVTVVEMAADRTRLFWYVFCFIFSSLAVFIFIMLQIAGVFILPWAATATSGFLLVGDGTNAGLFLFSGGLLSLVLYYYVDEILHRSMTGIVVKCILIIYWAGSILFVLFAGQRGLTMVAIVGLMLLLVLSVMRARRYMSWMLLLPAAAVSVLFVSLFVHLPLRLPVDFSSPVPDTSVALSVAAGALRERPFTGFGPGSYRTLYTRFFPEQLISTPLWSVAFYSSPSDALTILTDVGILGFVGWVVFLMMVLLTLIRQLKHEKSRNQMFFIGLVIIWLTVACAQWVTALSLVTTFLFWLLTALIIAWVVTEDDVGRVDIDIESHTLVPVAAVIGVFLCLVLIFFIRWFSGELLYARAVEQGRQADSADALEQATGFALRAAERAPHDDRMARFAAGAARMEFEALVRNQMQATNDAAGWMQEMIMRAKHAYTLHEDDPVNAALLGDSYAYLASVVAGAAEQAVDYWNRAVALAPFNYEYLTRRGDAYVVLFQNRTDGGRAAPDKVAKDAADAAGASFDRALMLRPSYADAYAGKAYLAVLLGNKQEAIQLFDVAHTYGALRPEYLYQFALLTIDAKEFARAGALLDEAITANPYFANALWYRGLLLEQTGNSAAAAADYERIIALQPENQAVLDRLQALEAQRQKDEVIQ